MNEKKMKSNEHVILQSKICTVATIKFQVLHFFYKYFICKPRMWTMYETLIIRLEKVNMLYSIPPFYLKQDILKFLALQKIKLLFSLFIYSGQII